MSNDKEKKPKKDKNLHELESQWIYYAVEDENDLILDIDSTVVNETVQDFADNSNGEVALVNGGAQYKPDLVTENYGAALPKMTLQGVDGEYEVTGQVLGGSHPTTTPPPRTR